MLRTAISLVLLALLIILGRVVYHYDIGVWIELLMLAVTTVAGMGALSLVAGKSRLTRFSHAESIALSAALGFIIAALVQWVALSVGLRNPIPLLIVAALAIVTLASTRAFSWAAVRIATLGKLLPFFMLVVLLFNLHGFQYGADGSIVTRGLFGQDLPFLAGEIDGLRYLPHLGDLHQSAQSWSYHDATYRVLAMSDPSDTLDLLAWAFPLFGYTVLAFGVYALADRWLRNRFAAALAVIIWFFSASFWGSELTSYALSPSFIVGSALLLALLVALHEYLDRRESRMAALVLLLLIALARFKLSTFLVVGPALGILALLMLKRERNAALVLGASAFVALVQLFLFGTPTDALMPAGDFLIGAPLLGYANHVAAILHQPLSRVNPVTHGGLELRSLLLVPYAIFHVLRLIILDPRVLVAVIASIIIVRRDRSAICSRIALLLLIAIPIGFLLPVLYSPAWYPLALSFYAPLVSAQAAVLLIAFAIDRATRGEFRKVWPGLALALVCLISLAFGFRSASRSISEPAFVISGDLRRALTDLKLRDTEDHALMASRRFDLEPTDTANDESFYWYAALSGHPVISEGAKYGSLLAAVADVDRDKGLHPVPAARELLARRRSELVKIYYSGDSEVVLGQLRRLGVGYILERTALGTPDERLHIDLSNIGVIAQQAGNTRIWRIR
jgi:hypothetical protein